MPGLKEKSEDRPRHVDKRPTRDGALRSAIWASSESRRIAMRNNIERVAGFLSSYDPPSGDRSRSSVSSSSNGVVAPAAVTNLDRGLEESSGPAGGLGEGSHAARGLITSASRTVIYNAKDHARGVKSQPSTHARRMYPPMHMP